MSPKLPDYTVNTLLPPTTPTTRPVARSTPGTHPAPTPAYHIVQLGLCNDLSGYEYAGSRTTKSHSAKTARPTLLVSAAAHSATPELDVSERCSVDTSSMASRSRARVASRLAPASRSRCAA